MFNLSSHSFVTFYRAAEECAVDNFLRAQLIQRIFRGYITRKHLELLHASAVIIQKNWRAFLGRALYRIRLKVKMNT